MKFDHFLSRLLLSAGVAVSLGLSYVISPAQDMPAIGTSPTAEQPATTGSSAAPAAAPANPSAPSTTGAGTSQTLAQSAAPVTPPTATEPPAAAEPAAPAAPTLSKAELAQLLAPIALYPDQLLGQILMASTYPLQIVEAARWVANPAHRRLKGDALTAALRDRNWDPSVMALVPFPQVLKLMSDRIEWTQKLGAAFVAQQADVMDEVQQLRQQAVDAGTFKSGPQCRCTVARTGGYWTVEPANPDVVYVPVYDAAAIYGPWAYPAYPPYLFPLPVGFAFAPGFFIGFGYGVDVAFYGPLWGWGRFDWGGHGIFVDPVRYSALSGGRGGFAGNVWVHNSSTVSTVNNISRTAIANSARTGTAATRALAARSGTRGAAATRATAAGTRTTGHAAVTGHASGRAGWSGGHSGHSSYLGSGHRASFAARGGFHGTRGYGSSGPAHAMLRAGAGGGFGHANAGGRFGFAHAGGGFGHAGGGGRFGGAVAAVHGGGAAHAGGGGQGKHR